jgi:hypothetical protein
VYGQVGSLVDSADLRKDRNAVYRYYNKQSSAVFGDYTATRTTLVQTKKSIKPGEQILVYYGSEYQRTAMPATQ